MNQLLGKSLQGKKERVILKIKSENPNCKSYCEIPWHICFLRKNKKRAEKCEVHVGPISPHRIGEKYQKHDIYGTSYLTA